MFQDQFDLTDRQFEIVTYLVTGLTNRQIGKKLKISEKTVKYHLNVVFKKMKVTSRNQVFYHWFKLHPIQETRQSRQE